MKKAYNTIYTLIIVLIVFNTSMHMRAEFMAINNSSSSSSELIQLKLADSIEEFQLETRTVFNQSISKTWEPYDSFKQRRRIFKRSASKHNKHKVRKQLYNNENSLVGCQKLDFNVDFVDLGWQKWILYPKRFNAYYCGGGCALPMNSIKKKSNPRKLSSQLTNHAQIMSILEYKHPGKNKPMTKCVSTKLKPLTVVFLDEYGELKTKEYQDMVVEECGCR
jgi:hypothetical protein